MSDQTWCPRCGMCCQLTPEGQCSGAYEGVCHTDNPDPEDPISLTDELAAANARIAELEQRTQHAEWERDTWKETAGTLTDQRNERNDVIAALTTRLAAAEAQVAELTAALKDTLIHLHANHQYTDAFVDVPMALRNCPILVCAQARAILAAAATPPAAAD